MIKFLSKEQLKRIVNSNNLRDRIFHNPYTNASSALCIQVNKETIEVIYDKCDEEYKMLCNFMENRDLAPKGLFIPKDAKNLTYLGGGAILIYDKEEVLRELFHRIEQ